MKRSLDPRLAVLSASETIDVKLAWGLQARQDPVFSCRTVERALQQWGECRKGGCLLPFPALSTTEQAVSWGPGRSRTGWTGTALPDLQELPGPQDPIAVFQYRQLWADPSFKNVMPSTCWAAWGQSKGLLQFLHRRLQPTTTGEWTSRVSAPPASQQTLGKQSNEHPPLFKSDAMGKNSSCFEELRVWEQGGRRQMYTHSQVASASPFHQVTYEATRETVTALASQGLHWSELDLSKWTPRSLRFRKASSLRLISIASGSVTTPGQHTTSEKSTQRAKTFSLWFSGYLSSFQTWNHFKMKARTHN